MWTLGCNCCQVIDLYLVLCPHLIAFIYISTFVLYNIMPCNEEFFQGEGGREGGRERESNSVVMCGVMTNLSLPPPAELGQTWESGRR